MKAAVNARDIGEAQALIRRPDASLFWVTDRAKDRRPSNSHSSYVDRDSRRRHLSFSSTESVAERDIHNRAYNNVSLWANSKRGDMVVFENDPVCIFGRCPRNHSVILRRYPPGSVHPHNDCKLSRSDHLRAYILPVDRRRNLSDGSHLRTEVRTGGSTLYCNNNAVAIRYATHYTVSDYSAQLGCRGHLGCQQGSRNCFCWRSLYRTSWHLPLSFVSLLGGRH